MMYMTDRGIHGIGAVDLSINVPSTREDRIRYFVYGAFAAALLGGVSMYLLRNTFCDPADYRRRISS